LFTIIGNINATSLELADTTYFLNLHVLWATDNALFCVFTELLFFFKLDCKPR